MKQSYKSYKSYKLDISGILVLLTWIIFMPVSYSGDSVKTLDELDCVIEPSEVVDISSSIRGIMYEVEVKRGDWVEEGQVLARLESSVETATVELAKARAQTTKLIQARKARFDMANKRFNRLNDLRKSKAIATQDLDEAQTDMVVAQIELEQANEDRRIASLELSRAEKMLALRTLQSPISGVVVQVYTDAGESVEDRPIMRIAQIDPLHVETIAPVKLFGKIREGAISRVFPEEPIGGQFNAEISMVERIIDAPSGTFGVRMILRNPDNILPAGLRCKVQFYEN